MTINESMSPFKNLTETRKYLSIREVEGYESRLKNGENKRELEKKEVIESLQKMGFDTTVVYKESGQPYLENYPGLHLSVSHSRGWIAVYISEKPVGIDIEPENPRILEGTAYFVNEREQGFEGNLNDLHLIWGAKEAFYKLKEGNIPDLKNEVTVLSIEQNELKIEFRGETYAFDYLQENGITIVIS